jgi:hypothetical protein
MLEVVQRQQEPSAGQAVHHGLQERHCGRVADAERLRERGDDVVRVADRAERNEHGAVGEQRDPPLVARSQATVYLQGEPGLARSRWAEDAHPALAGQKLPEFGQLAFAADERRQRRGRHR